MKTESTLHPKDPKQEIKAYANKNGWTDVHPHEVVRKISDITVEVRMMKTELVKAPKEFHEGGFIGHFADNHAQEYKYFSNENMPVIRIRWSKSKKQWQDKHGNTYTMDDQPYKFHDYNF